MAGIAADIEHRAGAQRLHRSIYKFLLMLPLLICVVICGSLVLTPSRIASLWLQRMQRASEASKVALENPRPDAVPIPWDKVPYQSSLAGRALYSNPLARA
jgi:hypothetical protein